MRDDNARTNSVRDDGAAARFVPAEGGRARYELRADDGSVVASACAGGGIHVQVHVPAVDTALVGDVLRAAVGLASEIGCGAIEIDSTDSVLRHVARGAGFDGALREPLRSGHPRDVAAAYRDPRDVVAVAREIERFTGTAVRAKVPTAWRSLVHSATAGVSAVIDLDVDFHHGGPHLQCIVPRRDDLLVESVARVVDVIGGVRAFFGTGTAPLRRVAFDYTSAAMVRHRHAGSIDPSSGTIHINASLVSVDGMMAVRRDRLRRANTTLPRPAPPPPGSRFNVIDTVAAHEMWHYVEQALVASRAEEMREMRCTLGACLGVETLEHATGADHHGASEQRRASRALLAAQVSTYATTNPREATAELFKLWWCRAGEPSPVVACFGECVQRFAAG